MSLRGHTELLFVVTQRYTSFFCFCFCSFQVLELQMNIPIAVFFKDNVKNYCLLVYLLLLLMFIFSLSAYVCVWSAKDFTQQTACHIVLYQKSYQAAAPSSRDFSQIGRLPAQAVMNGATHICLKAYYVWTGKQNSEHSFIPETKTTLHLT